MATMNDNGVKLSRIAPSTLATKQFYFMKIGSTGIVICAAATDCPIGILNNNPAANGTAEVQVTGLVKILAGGTIAIGDRIGTDSAGKGVAYVAGTDTTKYLVGQAVSAAASGEYFTALIDCLSPARGA